MGVIYLLELLALNIVLTNVITSINVIIIFIGVDRNAPNSTGLVPSRVFDFHTDHGYEFRIVFLMK